MPWKESEDFPDGNGPVHQEVEFGSDQPAPVDVFQRIDEIWDRGLDKIMRFLEQHTASLEHGARQPRLAMEADGPANTKTRERTEGAVTAVQAMRGDSFTAGWVKPGPKTKSTGFGMEAEPSTLPSRDDVVVECANAAPKSCLPSLEMRPSTAAGGLVPTGETSTTTETSFNQPPLRFCATVEKYSEASSKGTDQRTSTLYTSLDSSVFQEGTLPATPY